MSPDGRLSSCQGIFDYPGTTRLVHLIFKRQSTFPNDSLPQMCQKGYFVLLCQEIGQCIVNFVLWLLSIFKLLHKCLWIAGGKTQVARSRERNLGTKVRWTLAPG